MLLCHFFPTQLSYTLLRVSQFDYILEIMNIFGKPIKLMPPFFAVVSGTCSHIVYNSKSQEPDADIEANGGT